jgi:FKBP-type peptidyl-prolyl cis-trans isomerase
MLTRVGIVIGSVVVIAAIIGGVVLLSHDNSSSKSSTGSSNSPVASVAATDGKLQSTDEVVGTGAEAKVGSTITVKYTGTLTDGTVFDSTAKQGGTPATFTLAQGQLIEGWVQGIPGMKVGGKRKLVIPAALGYGSQSVGSIPANSTLIFEIELVDVK